jgi:hypothetical protein
LAAVLALCFVFRMTLIIHDFAKACTVTVLAMLSGGTAQAQAQLMKHHNETPANAGVPERSSTCIARYSRKWLDPLPHPRLDVVLSHIPILCPSNVCECLAIDIEFFYRVVFAAGVAIAVLAGMVAAREARRMNRNGVNPMSLSWQNAAGRM